MIRVPLAWEKMKSRLNGENPPAYEVLDLGDSYVVGCQIGMFELLCNIHKTDPKNDAQIDFEAFDEN